MNLHDYLSSSGRTAKQFAELLNVPPPLVSQWRTGERRVPAERCPDIEKATDGAVTCEELRDDIDWAVLRGTGTAEPAAA